MSPDPTVPNPSGESVSQEALRKLQFLVSTHRAPLQDLAGSIGVRAEILQDILDGQSSLSPRLIKSLAKHFGVSTSFFDPNMDMVEDATGESRERNRATLASVGDYTQAPSRSSDRGASTPAPQALGFEGLAVRYQALIELMVQKGVITAAEYQAQIRAVEGRRK